MNKKQTIDHDELNVADPRRRRTLFAIAGLLGTGSALQFVGRNQVIDQAHAYQERNKSLSAAGFFDKDQRLLVKAMCDVVIPKSDTPSASDVDTHGLIDAVLMNCYGAQDQAAISKLLRSVNNQAQERYSADFIDLSDSQRLALLHDFDSPNSGSSSDAINLDAAQSFRFFKVLVVLGYVTSEAGATQHLNYVPIPNGFEADVPLSEEPTARSSIYYY